MLWDGHKFDSDVRTSAVDRGYTMYSMEYMLIEIEKSTTTIKNNLKQQKRADQTVCPFFMLN